MRHAPLGDDVDLVGVAGEVRHEGDHVVVLVQHAAAVPLLGTDDVRHQPAAGVALVALRRAQLGLDRLPDERRRVDLAVRVRIGDADDVALVLEAQHLANLRARAQLARLAAPHVDDLRDRRRRHLGQRQIVTRREADDARGADGGRRAVERRRDGDVARRVRAHARVIVVEHERALVARVDRARDAGVPRAEVAAGIVGRQLGRGRRHRLARPRPLLPVRRHDHPLLAQRMPPLFPAPGAGPVLRPSLSVRSASASSARRARRWSRCRGCAPSSPGRRRRAARRRPAPVDRRRAGRSRAPGSSCRSPSPRPRSPAAPSARGPCRG